MKALKSYLIITCLLAFALSSAYAEDHFINEITKLYRAGKIAKAYELAEKYLLEAEGDPAFDYLYGLVAIDSGHIGQGVFAFERILMLRPNDRRVRLELARGYFLLEQYDRASQEFTKVLDTNPPVEVKVNISKFIDAIRLGEASYKTTMDMYMELGLGYDTNVNSSPSGANFDSPMLGPGTLNDASVAIKDSYYSYAVGANINHPVKPELALFGDVSASYKTFEDAPEFNLRSMNLQGGVILSGERSRLKIGIQWQDFEVGHDRYRELLALNGDIRWQLNNQMMFSGFAQLADMNYLQNRSRDSWQQMAGIGFQHRFSIPYHPLLSVSFYGGAERSRQETITAESLVDRDIYGLNIETQLTMTSTLTLSFAAMLQESRYRSDDVFFLVKRDDEYRNISVKTTWKRYRGWDLSVNLDYTENGSNISINRYRRTQGGMAIRYDY